MKLKAFICAVLAVATIAIYWQVRNHGFVNYDDDIYLTSNPHVVSGLTWENVRWAFHSHSDDYWRPLTWLSFMLDFQLFGLKAGAHHLANVVFHLACALLLFQVFHRMTRALWRSAWVAALFACHPLQVQSVAWVAERGEALSACFWMLTLWAYARYVEFRHRGVGAGGRGSAETSGVSVDDSCSDAVSSARSTRSYRLALVFFALGLMSKPTLVTLPFVLLLLDYWPLRRFQLPLPLWRQSTLNSLSRACVDPSSTLRRLFLEKMPFVALSALSSVITFLGQQRMGNVASTEAFPLDLRLGNALISYVRYLGKAFWPTHLAAFYPHPGYWPEWQVIGAGLILLGVSFLALRMVQRCPFLLVGWLWFLGMLLPVIGLIQVGPQAMADRYAYLPLIGLFIMVSWGTADLSAFSRHRRLVAGTFATAATALLAACAAIQTSHWRDSVSLWLHTLACTSGNFLAHNNLAAALTEQQKWDEAIQHCERALQLKPNYAEAHNNLGVSLTGQRREEEAIQHFNRALQLEPDHLKAHNNLGTALGARGELNEAVRHFERALQINPDCAEAHANLGNALGAQGKWAEALEHCKRALQITPDYPEAHNNLGNAYAVQGKWTEAIHHYKQALQLQPAYPEAHYNLGNALGRRGHSQEAMLHFQQALNLAAAQGKAALAQAIRARLKSDPSPSPESPSP